MSWRQNGTMDLSSMVTIGLAGLFSYAAWLTSIGFSAANGMHPLMVAAALFFPVGVVHGVGLWFGGW